MSGTSATFVIGCALAPFLFYIRSRGFGMLMCDFLSRVQLDNLWR